MAGTAQTDRSEQAGAVDGPQNGGVPDRERTFTWDDPMATFGEAAAMSGMELFTAMMEGRIPPPPIMNALGFSGFSFEEGHARFSLVPQEFHYNPIGSVHGGVYAAMLDSACGCAVHTRLPAGVFYTSLDLSLKFLRPITIATGEVTAEGEVVHLGRRTALASARLVDAAGKVYATANSSCLIIRPE
ncbi:MAG: PaaI family thioesterase [Actinocrinis sp.]